MYYFNKSAGEYARLTNEIYEQVQANAIRFWAQFALISFLIFHFIQKRKDNFPVIFYSEYFCTNIVIFFL